jgi:hypothetical protein
MFGIINLGNCGHPSESKRKMFSLSIREKIKNKLIKNEITRNIKKVNSNKLCGYRELDISANVWSA